MSDIDLAQSPMAEFYREGQVLLFDKPLNWTSFDVVKKVKNQFKYHLKLKKFKVGHAVTLDPLASGLLIVCTGKYTKRIQEIQDASKVYQAEITFVGTRPSYDKETEIDETFDTSHITRELIEETLKNQFTGEIEQLPPVFSALKVNGKKAYKLARAGKEVELKPRLITIYNIEILSIDLPVVTLNIHCTKGTYIRSIANDLGKALNSGAYLSGLIRTKIGDFDIANALSPAEFQIVEFFEAADQVD